MKENSRNNNGEILLTDVSSKLREARKLARNVLYQLHDFADFLLAGVASNNHSFALCEMIMLLAWDSRDLLIEVDKFTNTVQFPEKLTNEKTSD